MFLILPLQPQHLDIVIPVTHFKKVYFPLTASGYKHLGDTKKIVDVDFGWYSCCCKCICCRDFCWWLRWNWLRCCWLCWNWLCCCWFCYFWLGPHWISWSCLCCFGYVEVDFLGVDFVVPDFNWLHFVDFVADFVALTLVDFVKDSCQMSLSLKVFCWRWLSCWKRLQSLLSRRSIIVVTGFFLIHLSFLPLCFLLADLGTPLKAMLVKVDPDFDFLNQSMNSFSVLFYSATANTCSHVFVVLITQLRPHFVAPPLPGLAQKI